MLERSHDHFFLSQNLRDPIGATFVGGRFEPYSRHEK